jgi:Family of unknown function (DUF5678)
MTELEHIKQLALNLTPEEKQALARFLVDSGDQESASSLGESFPNNGDDEIRRRRMEWLESHREEYAGQYVALAGDVLVGHGATIREAHQQAKENGVENPFLVRLTSESEVLFAGW